ncbi:MAG: hypothetical protein NUV85_02950, partial [Candidatus Berkelbacteria bacterium]|nr:hypothetical protein [Candidatus Berkelbacteria bacterium]
MKRSINVLLELGGQKYKFLKISATAKNPSYYIHDHIMGDDVPFMVSEPITILKKKGIISTEGIPRRRVDGKNCHHHISLHPNRIYLKKKSREDNTEEHLITEFNPQPFSTLGSRLVCIITPAPIPDLPIHATT